VPADPDSSAWIPSCAHCGREPAARGAGDRQQVELGLRLAFCTRNARAAKLIWWHPTEILLNWKAARHGKWRAPVCQLLGTRRPALRRASMPSCRRYGMPWEMWRWSAFSPVVRNRKTAPFGYTGVLPHLPRHAEVMTFGC